MIAQVNVTTYHNDNTRTGQNTQETVLTLANVNTSTFGVLFWLPLDGQVYAQPLILSKISIAGGTHNVAYLATENDSVYAVDADTGTVYWHRQLLYNGGHPIHTGDFGFNSNITPQYGITGTPVIDPASNTLYAVASSEEGGPIAVHRLHALDTITGADKPGANWIVVGGSYGGVVACSKYADWIATSTQACTPDTRYPNDTHCSAYVSGPTGFISSSAATVGVPPGNILGPSSWCNYTYIIGPYTYQKQLTAQ